MLTLGFILLTNTPAEVTVKNGSSCTKLNATTAFGGFQYTCIKSGKKLIWKKGLKENLLNDEEKCRTLGLCKVGMIGPGGGIVFYDAGAQFAWGRYLEFAPPGWNGSETEPDPRWCDSDASLSPRYDLTLATGIGDGKSNTNLISKICKSGAAVLARSYKGGGKNDWYLPSIYELKALSDYILDLDPARTFRIGSELKYGFKLWNYWSSSGNDAYDDWLLEFTTSQYFQGIAENNSNYARPIRSF